MPYGYGETVVTTAADVSRNFGQWQDRAISGPVIVTHHGRARVVLISADQYASWQGEASPRAGDGRAELSYETSLAAVLEHVEEGFLALDRDLVITGINGVAEDFIGRTRTTLIGQPLLSAFPELDGSIVLDRIRRVLRSGSADKVEGKCPVFPDRFIRHRVFPYPNGVAVMFANITEALHQEEELRLAQAGVAALEESTQVSYLQLNVRGVIVGAGQRFCEAVGLSPKEVVGVRLGDLIALNQRRPLHEALETVLQHGRQITQQAKLLTKRHEEVSVQFSIAPVMNGYANEGAYVLVAFNPAVNVAA